MGFEYIRGVRGPGDPGASSDPFVPRIVDVLRRLPGGASSGSVIKTVHGELRASCRALSAAECGHLGLSSRSLHVDGRFALHIEGQWRLPEGVAADIVVETFGTWHEASISAGYAYLCSSRQYIDLSPEEVERIERELLSALQLLVAPQ